MPNSADSADEDEEEEEEEFYESLDRILSSSSSSTSTSDDDGGGGAAVRRCPRFPPASAASFEVWISEPTSIEERRLRLLRQMGLAGDPALSRRKSSAVSGDERAAAPEMGRSVSCDGICASRPSAAAAAAAAVISRSRSDSSVEPAPSSNPSKPPLAARSRSRTPSGIELDVSDGEGRQSDDDDRRCTIRNLDNGREFVVKWNKLREVGTGQQLTMEEFEMCVGRSPIVQELMRRENVEESRNGGVGSVGGGCRAAVKKRGSWFRSIKTVVAGGGSHRERRSSDDKDTSSEKGGRRSSSATDDSQDGLNSVHHGLERSKVRHYGKSHKELSGLYMSQEIRGHKGAVWCIRFSLDGRYLASAGEDCVIHVWQQLDVERKGELVVERAVEENGSCNPFGLVIGNESPEPVLGIACIEGSHWEKKRRAKVPGGRKSVSSEQLVVPDHVFALSEKPVCSFRGHLDDVLDLSWSKSEYLLSSSMDKTVRLWHLSSNACLKTFSHSDYVTCIQFNPVDDRYFISGSLDEKVRIWSIPDRQVVDWNDLHEMVTAACYTPDGKGALVGSHKGSCHLYNTSDNKLLQKCQLNLQNKRKRSSHKKITGFQFTPGSSSEVLITSADSRIRVVDGVELVHKFRGFRNTSSQISACLTPNGKYVICASEDSHVYVWRYDANSRPSRSKGVVPVTQSYEHFYCRDVTAAVPWPSTSMVGSMQISKSTRQNGPNGVVKFDTQVPAEPDGHDITSFPPYICAVSSQNGAVLSNPNTNTSHFGDRVSATWPEEKLLKHSHQRCDESCNGGVPVHGRSAWGMVIVTAGRGGEIRTFQNFGFPVRV